MGQFIDTEVKSNQLKQQYLSQRQQEAENKRRVSQKRAIDKIDKEIIKNENKRTSQRLEELLIESYELYEPKTAYLENQKILKRKKLIESSIDKEQMKLLRIPRDAIEEIKQNLNNKYNQINKKIYNDYKLNEQAYLEEAKKELEQEEEKQRQNILEQKEKRLKLNVIINPIFAIIKIIIFISLFPIFVILKIIKDA